MRAFTLLEVLLVTSLVIILGVATTWVSLQFFIERQMRLTVNVIQSELSQAHLYALSGKADSAWGVTQQGSNLILFAGNSYDDRAASLDEVWPLPRGTELSGFGERVFQKTQGTTDSKSFVIQTFHRSLSGSLNQEGVVQWYEE